MPLYGPGGSLSGVRARRTVAKGPSSTKELVPADSSVAGLVLANPTARKVLRGELTKPIVVVCKQGQMAGAAVGKLTKAGYCTQICL